MIFTSSNPRWRGRGVVYCRRHWVFLAARLECMLAAGSWPGERELSARSLSCGSWDSLVSMGWFAFLPLDVGMDWNSWHLSVGVGTKIDPTLCRADRMVGQVLGAVGALPDIFIELEISYFLLRRLLGVRTEGDKKGAKVSGVFVLSNWVDGWVGDFLSTWFLHIYKRHEFLSLRANSIWWEVDAALPIRFSRFLNFRFFSEKFRF